MNLAVRATLAALVVAGCGARAQTTAYPIVIEARPVALRPDAPHAARLGALSYAGGVALRARGTASFGGLSGLDVDAEGRLVAVTDAGDLIRGRLTLDGDRRLVGVEEATIARLTDERGQAFQGKASGDAEGVTLLDDGGFAVSFEQDHRVLVYPPQGRPRRTPVPADAELGPNTGIEALAAWTDPATGGPRLVMGAERGDAWSCDTTGQDCRRILDAADRPGADFRLTGVDALPDGSLVAIYRAASLLGGLRAVVAWIRPGADKPVTQLARLEDGVTVDNMEAIAAVPNADGSIRLYLASDDNFAGWQRTLLLAFDWTPVVRP